MDTEQDMSEQTTGIRGKVLTSAKLATLRFAFQIGARLISTVILTRLLAPEIYGVFAIVLVYLYILEMFSDLGIRSVIITKEGEVEDDFLRTCWTVAILRGVIIAGVASLIAAAIGWLQSMQVFAADSPYVASELPWALATLGATMIIGGLLSPMQYVQERNMAFGKVTWLNIATNLIGLFATVALAYSLRSVWALVLGNVVRTVFFVAMSFIFFPGPRMRPLLDRTYLGIIIDRGKWIIGHSILTALTNSGDRLLLGFAMSSSTFGFYYIARQLVDMVQIFLNSINAQMGLQVFSHLHKSTVTKFRHNYYRYRLFFDATAGLSVGALVVLSPLIVEILFDDRYREVAQIAQILIWGMLLTGPLLLRSAFSAERRFKEMTLLSVVSTVTLWVGLVVAIFMMDSQELALIAIALHRLPEAMWLILLGGDRDWVIIWREFIGFAFCILGLLMGQTILRLWNVLI